MKDYNFIPIFLRLPGFGTTPNEAPFRNIAINLHRLSKQLQITHQVNVRFSFEQKLPSTSSGTQCQQQLQSTQGLDIRFCFSSPNPNQSLSLQSPNWSQPNTGWRSNPSPSKNIAVLTSTTFSPGQRIDVLWTNATPSPDWFTDAGKYFIEQINNYFSSCNANAMYCVLNTNDAGTCGDGIVTGTEECDLLPIFKSSMQYYNTPTDRFTAGCTNTCKRASNSLIKLKTTTGAIQTPSQALQSCINSGCGILIYDQITTIQSHQLITTYSNQQTCPKNWELRGCLRDCIYTIACLCRCPPIDNSGYTASPIFAAYQTIGLGTPAKPPADTSITLGGQFPITCFNQVCKHAVTYQWRCRQPHYGLDDLYTGWQLCDSTSGTEYVPRDQNKSIPDGQIPYLPFNDLIEITNINTQFTCGKTYFRRQVRCTATYDSSSPSIINIFPDGYCSTRTPPTIVLGRDVPCITYGYVDVYATTQQPSLQSFKHLTDTLESIQIGPPLVNPYQPNALPPQCNQSGQQLPNIICFNGCNATYTRFIECLQYSPVQFQPDTNTPLTTPTIIKSTSCSDPSFLSGIYYSYEYDSNRCTYDIDCSYNNVRKQCNSLIPIDCNCNIESMTYQRDCWGTPINNIAQYTLPSQKSLSTKCLTPPETIISDSIQNCIKYNRDTLHCYDVLLTFTQQDENDPPTTQLLPPTSFTSEIYNRYCIAQHRNETVYTPHCINTYTNANLSDTNLPDDFQLGYCLTSTINDAMKCKITTAEWRCLITANDDNNDIPKDVLINYGFKNHTIHNAASCDIDYIPPLSEKFCGRVHFTVSSIICWDIVNNTTNTNDFCISQQLVLPPSNQIRTIDYTDGCLNNCYDAAYDYKDINNNPIYGVKLISQCNSIKPLNWTQIHCGTLHGLNEDCMVSKRYAYSLCQMLLYNSTTEYINIYQPTLFCNNIDPQLQSATPSLPQSSDCFKLSQSIGVSFPIESNEYNILDELTYKAIDCQFRPLCRYTLVNGRDSSMPIRFPINPKINIAAGTWSTHACTTLFNCDQNGFCGSPVLQSTCGLFKNNALVGYPEYVYSSSRGNEMVILNQNDNNNYITSRPTFNSFEFANHFNTDEDILPYDELQSMMNIPQYYNNDLNQNGYNISNIFTTQNYPDAQLSQQLRELFTNIISDTPCGNLTPRRPKDDQCSSTTNCIIPLCYLPDSLLFNNDTISDELYTPEACTSSYISKHCVMNVTDDVCEKAKLKLYFKCFHQETLLNSTIGCGFESISESQPGIAEVDCTIVNGCNVWTQECFWENNNHGRQGIFSSGILASLSNPSEELCTQIDQAKTDINLTNELCDSFDFCGNSITSSSCQASHSDDPAITFQLSDEMCQHKMLNYKSYKSPSIGVQCNDNYNACSTWACSIPGLESSLPSLLSSTYSHTGTTVHFPSAATFFDPNNGVISSNRCNNEISSTSIQSNTCGLSQLFRQVGCLITKPSTYFTLPSYDYLPNAIQCGSNQLPGRKLIPIKSLPITSTLGCEYILECAIGSSLFDAKLCDLLTCPIKFGQIITNENDNKPILPPTTFNDPNQIRCRSTSNNYIVSLEYCGDKNNNNNPTLPKSISGKIIDVQLRCPTTLEYCSKNKRIPMGYGINANVTDENGKYYPEKAKRYRESNQDHFNPLKLNYMIDAACTIPSRITQFNLLQGQIPLNRNTTVAPDSTITISFTYTYYSTSTLIFSLYFVPVPTSQSTSFQLPYLITTLPPTVNSQHTIKIPSYLPNGEYIVVLYANNMLFSWIPDVFITMKHQSDYTLETVANSISILESSSSTTYNPIINQIEGIVGSCNGLLCFNGKCEKNEDGNDYCKCNNGFTGQYCAQSTSCTIPTSTDDDQPTTTFECNTKYGVYSMLPTTTQYSPMQESIPCDTCHCLNPNFDSSIITNNDENNAQIGCNTCLLQCGYGQPNSSCTQCQCPNGYSGTQCQCYTKQLTLWYKTAPPFITTMFTSKSNNNDDMKYKPQTIYDTIQLYTWKKSIINDLAIDLHLSIHMFEVVKWGSTKDAFGVVVNIRKCIPYIDRNTIQQQGNTQEQILSNFTTTMENEFISISNKIKELQRITNETAPLIGYNDVDNHLQWYQPSFDFNTLYRRFKTIQTASNHQFITNTLQQNEKEINTPNNDTIINQHNHHNNKFSTLQSTTTTPGLVSPYEYSQTAIATSIIADTSGGFLGIGLLSDPIKCTPSAAAAPSSSSMIQPSTNMHFYQQQEVQQVDNYCETTILTPRLPDPYKPIKKPFNKNILLYIFLPLLFLILFTIALLLCFSFKRQIWCFKDFNKNRQEKRRKDREFIQRMATTTTNTGTNTTMIASSTPPNTTTKQTGLTSKQAPSESSNQHHPTSRLSTTRPESRHVSKQSSSKQAIIISSNPDFGGPKNNTQQPQLANIDDDEDDEGNDEFFAEGMEVQQIQQQQTATTKLSGKRQSIKIGGLRRVSVAGLPSGWSMLTLEGKDIYINTETMQSSTIKPNEDGTIPTTTNDDKGW